VVIQRSSLTEAELEITRSTKRSALVDLDEDALLELHGRVRRARNKCLGQYRRQAAGKVRDVGGRGKAYAQNRLARDKAEVFETALANVSTALAKAARRAAAELRLERISAARSRAVRGSAASDELLTTPTAEVDPSAEIRPPRKSTGRQKRDASDIAIGRRNQARRDNR